jgi:predicted RNA-binding protein Jag
MVDFVQLQNIIKEQLEQDRTISAVETTGTTLELAVSEAATLLDIPVRRLEYEVAERGSAGIFGAGKKDWKIRAYERAIVRKEKPGKAGAEVEAETPEAPIIEDRDGDVFVHLSSDGAFLKVAPPIGKGRKAQDAHAMQALLDRGVTGIDEAQISKLVRDSGGVYVKVGDFEHKPANDSMVSVEISADEMKAHITVTPPGPGGCLLAPYQPAAAVNAGIYAPLSCALESNEAFLAPTASIPAMR